MAFGGDRALRGSWLATCVLLALAGLAPAVAPRTAAAAEYVDAGTPDVKPEERAVVAHPQPVQLLFQFQTKGALNGAATKAFKAQVLETVKASGAFSDVGEAPVPNGAVLNVVINNYVDPGDMSKAAAKGVATGATLFLVGNTVKDNYLCTIDYVAGPGAPTITKTAHHALYTQVGLTAPTPPNAVKIGAIKDAINVMIRQIVSNPLNAVASDPAFQAAAAPAQTAPPAPEPQAAPPPPIPVPAPAAPPAPARP